MNAWNRFWKPLTGRCPYCNDKFITVPSETGFGSRYRVCPNHHYVEETVPAADTVLVYELDGATIDHPVLHQIDPGQSFKG
ncbi:hypothetical protein OS242_04125 [Tumebacillus sp. DT12]|uniref:Uncharacterized protein n=1 Tax=Tumebacillus lacus TaxID=2995335 RepID=A0ABT3WWZ5_9BACL|nr:hypothetical protein [Tumebacillus lacus]MCX7569146.1 hypothetical protein [Tumebacillus lacus]